MSFENFPYSNFHELNLDWIVQKIKEAYSSENPPDFPVKSVNGMTGDVIIAIPSNFVQSVNGETGDVVLYRNPLTQFPATDEVRWNLFRICDGTETGIEFDENGASRIEGIRRIKIYDEDNPPEYPVTSVNGQTGDVQITAGVQSVNGKTGNVVTPFVNPNTDILTLDSNSPSILWGISRNVAGGNVALYITSGSGTPQAFIRYTPDGGQAINLPLLTNADIPESAGVVSVNTKTGVVTLYGTDIYTQSESNTTILQALTNEENSRSIADTQLNERINTVSQATDALITRTSDTNLWAQGSYYSADGSVQNILTFCRLIDYIPDDYIRVIAESNLSMRLVAWENDVYIGQCNENYAFTKTFGGTDPAVKEFTNIDLQYFKTNFPTYKFKLNTHTIPQTNITPSITSNIFFLHSNIDELTEDINELENSINTLQGTTNSHSQQIATLQSANNTQNQQISALQETSNSYSQQIAELYTRIGTGIKEVKFTDVVSLPIRYPETGTDADITENMACVNAILSRPGVQRTNLTIVFYNGYLTISGTIQGLTDIYLYLTKT